MDKLLTLLPEKNVACGYLAAGFVWAVIHLLTLVSVNLTTDQTVSLTGAAAIVAAHVWDTVAKLRDAPPPPPATSVPVKP